MESQGDAGNHRITRPLLSDHVWWAWAKSTQQSLSGILLPTVALSSNFLTATVAVSNNFGPTMRITHFLSPTVAVSNNFGPTERITHFLETISNVVNMFGESRSILGREKTSPSHPELGRMFSSALSKASAFSSLRKPDIGTATEQADKIKDGLNGRSRSSTTCDCAKSRFERTNPKFDSMKG
jgi:hypothetical protein